MTYSYIKLLRYHYLGPSLVVRVLTYKDSNEKGGNPYPATSRFSRPSLMGSGNLLHDSSRSRYRWLRLSAGRSRRHWLLGS
jgi:hypothetical protein